MDLKTIARYLNLVAAELRVITTGSVESRQIQMRAKSIGRVMTRAGGTTDSLAAGRIGVRHLDNPDLVQAQMGDDGDRLMNGREDPGNQGWEIEPLAAGSGTHLRRRNAEYR